VGSSLGLRAKNLGVSFTGTLTHNFYLRHYGASPGTRWAILMFFEGNDIEDAVLEHQRVEAYRQTGIREYRGLDAQRETSFLTACMGLLLRAMASVERPESALAHNAIFLARDSDQPVSVKYAPPNADDLTPLARQVLEDALAGWATTAIE